MMVTDRFREGTKRRPRTDDVCSAFGCGDVMLGVYERKIYVFEGNLCFELRIWNKRRLKPKYLPIYEQFYGWHCTFQHLTSSPETKLTDREKLHAIIFDSKTSKH
jgi:hypothetical protein